VADAPGESRRERADDAFVYDEPPPPPPPPPIPIREVPVSVPTRDPAASANETSPAPRSADETRIEPPDRSAPVTFAVETVWRWADRSAPVAFAVETVWRWEMDGWEMGGERERPTQGGLGGGLG
jgi:hypothetical protein